MSVGTIIAVLVAVESVLVLAAVRWLVKGLREAVVQERPAITPLAPVIGLPTPRDTASLRDEQVAAAS
jgi:hypothetical protein